MSDITPSIAIVGASGKIAESIIRLFSSETQYRLLLFSTKYQEKHINDRISLFPIDYDNPKAFREQCLALLPKFIINTAAMTDVDMCEIQKQQAWKINVTWVEQLARTCAIIDSHLIHFSTDYVFDGKQGPYSENDIPNPLSYYGKSKLAGENACKQFHGMSTIIRTNVVYGYSRQDKPDFVQWLINKHEKNEQINVVNDQFSNPTFSDDISLCIKKIIEKRRVGLYHCGGPDYCNRYEFALTIFSIFHLDKSLLHEITTSSLEQTAKRPLRGGLISLKAETDLGIRFSSIEQGLITLRHQQYTLPNKTGIVL